MKMSVGTLVNALMIAERLREAHISGVKRVENYGQLIVVGTTLRKTLEGCNFEIELSPSAEECIPPFISSEIFRQG